MYFQSYRGIPLPINDINVETYTCSVLRASLKSSCSESNFSFTLVFLIMNTCIKFIEKMRINFLYTDIIHFFIIQAHHQKLLASEWETYTLVLRALRKSNCSVSKVSLALVLLNVSCKEKRCGELHKECMPSCIYKQL